MVDMIATKRLRYGTRRMQPGEAFEAHRSNAKKLVAIGKARYATRYMVADDAPAAPAFTLPAGGLAIVGERGPDLVDLPRGSSAEPNNPAPASDADERPALRAAYEAKFGRKPFPGWSSELLREKLAADA